MLIVFIQAAAAALLQQLILSSLLDDLDCQGVQPIDAATHKVIEAQVQSAVVEEPAEESPAFKGQHSAQTPQRINETFGAIFLHIIEISCKC
jgi:hypothetical protein